MRKCKGHKHNTGPASLNTFIPLRLKPIKQTAYTQAYIYYIRVETHIIYIMHTYINLRSLKCEKQTWENGYGKAPGVRWLFF